MALQSCLASYYHMRLIQMGMCKQQEGRQSCMSISRALAQAVQILAAASMQPQPQLPQGTCGDAAQCSAQSSFSSTTHQNLQWLQDEAVAQAVS